jgi:hypothetical protein
MEEIFLDGLIQLPELIGGEFFEDDSFQNQAAVLKIFHISFNKRPTVDVTNVAFTVGPQKIETAHVLAENLYNFFCNELFIRS